MAKDCKCKKSKKACLNPAEDFCDKCDPCKVVTINVPSTSEPLFINTCCYPDTCLQLIFPPPPPPPATP